LKNRQARREVIDEALERRDRALNAPEPGG
jgi:hypothetical protein